MANQPKKYKKFVATAATATLVASAIVPVASAASFSDVVVGGSHSEAINALADQGIIKGYADGTFKPGVQINRGQTVKLLGRWLESQGYEIPADWNSVQRFSDVPVNAADQELVKYAALVKDAGVFNGSQGKLNASQPMQRQHMAVVLVRAIKNVLGEDLVQQYKDAGFVSSIEDLDQAYANENREAIIALEYAGITKVSDGNFRPTQTVTRGQFASFLYRTINLDTLNATVDSIKAINNTTVEVTFKEAVDHVNVTDFEIDGLEVKNAAVKQTDAKTVVLTTAAQEGGKTYTVSYNGKKLGSFQGISAVVPQSITLEKTAIQAVVGQQVTLKANIGVKEAGVPVTFNIDAANNALNKDIVAEVYTDENGIAQYSYTQYNAGTSDDVAVYATGNPSKRATAIVWWGVDTILDLQVADEKGNTVNNDDSKTYKVVYKDAKTGKPVEGQLINITFKENIDVNVDKTTSATVNGVNPKQLLNGTVTQISVRTNSKGEATFTVSGKNTTATPVVFVDNNNNGKLDNNELRVEGQEIKFEAVQASYDISVERDGDEEAAIGNTNGRKYKITVKTKDGKVAAGEIVNVSFNELLDGVINTTTDAVIRDDADFEGEFVSGVNTQKAVLKLNSKGEAEFLVTSNTPNSYATPIVWIDVNDSTGNENQLDKGEPYKVADITYFANEKIASGILKTYNQNNYEVKSNSYFNGTDTAKFRFSVANQSGKAYSGTQPALRVSYTVYNDGVTDIQVSSDKGLTWTKVAPNRSLTETVYSRAGENNELLVKPDGDKSATARVVATATTDDSNATYLGSKTLTAKFVSTNSVSDKYTGVITSIDVANEKIFFDNKADGVSYKDATFTAVGGGTSITKEGFVSLLKTNQYVATYNKDADGKVTIELISVYAIGATSGSVADGNLVVPTYASNTLAVGSIKLSDADLNLNPAVAETVDVEVSDGLSKPLVVRLTETGPNTGVFQNNSTVDLSGLANGKVTVSYVDQYNTSGKSETRIGNITKDGTAPSVALKTTATNDATTFTVDVSDTTPTTIDVDNSTVPTGLTVAVDNSTGAFTITGTSAVNATFEFTVTDAAGNVTRARATFDNSTSKWAVTTL